MSAIETHPTRSGWRIVIAGTGGQGVLTAARLLCEGFVALGHDVVSGQLHGMAQRGGAVQSSVLIDAGISPVIASGRADFVIGLEPVETARALPLVSARTVVFSNTEPVVPSVLSLRSACKGDDGTYPDAQSLEQAVRARTSHVFHLDATRAALDAGSVRALNMVMLGCMLGFGGLPRSAEVFWNTVADRIPGRLREINAAAYQAGVTFAEQLAASGAAR